MEPMRRWSPTHRDSHGGESPDPSGVHVGGVVPELACRGHVEINGTIRSAEADSGGRPGCHRRHRGTGFGGRPARRYFIRQGVRVCPRSSPGGDQSPRRPRRTRCCRATTSISRGGLIVSGGHTHLYHVEGIRRYRLVGHTTTTRPATTRPRPAWAPGYPGGRRSIRPFDPAEGSEALLIPQADDGAAAVIPPRPSGLFFGDFQRVEDRLRQGRSQEQVIGQTPGGRVTSWSKTLAAARRRARNLRFPGRRGGGGPAPCAP